MCKFEFLKKRGFFLLAIFLMIVVGAFHEVSAGFIQINLSASDQGTAFSLMQQTASGFFSMRIQDIQPYQEAGRPTRVFSVFYLASECHASPHQVWQRHQRLGWGRMSGEYGYSPDKYGKYMSGKHHARYRPGMVINDDDYEEIMTVRFLHEYYGMSPEVIYFWHDRGLGYEDLFLGFNLGVRLRLEPREFFKLRMASRDWRFIARRYRVPYEVLMEPVPPIHRIIIINSDDDNRDRDDYDRDHHHRRHHDHD